MKISGFNYDAISAFIYMEMGDKDVSYNQELLEDILSGGDVIRGSYFNDILNGFGGNDEINGGRRQDMLDGGNGDDRLIGGAGSDTMTGGAGNDAFRYEARNQAPDSITDFSSSAANNDDYFEFAAADFGGLPTGILDAARFQSSDAATAQSADVRFFFETDTGILRYDEDGQGGKAAMIIATLQPGATMTFDDIFLI